MAMEPTNSAKVAAPPSPLLYPDDPVPADVVMMPAAVTFRIL